MDIEVKKSVGIEYEHSEPNPDLNNLNACRNGGAIRKDKLGSKPPNCTLERQP